MDVSSVSTEMGLGYAMLMEKKMIDTEVILASVSSQNLG